MKKITLLIPVYNDWESLIQLLNDINKIILEIKNYQFNCIVINDASTCEMINILKPSNLEFLKIINMRKNTGHQRCIAFGVKHIVSNNLSDYVVIMDGDGEDRPVEIKNFIMRIEKDETKSVVAKRVKRSEGLVFRIFYEVHKVLTLIFTGKKINFGNFTCLTKTDLKILSEKINLWNNYSGTFKKYILKYNEINSSRGLRYCGNSKMSFFNLIFHSLSIISVFKYSVFLRSSFFIIILSFLTKYISVYAIALQLLLVIFNLMIFVISLRENKNNFFSCNDNTSNEIDVPH